VSVVAPLMVCCPHCRAEFQAPVYASLHVRRAPQVRDAILDGAFQREPCPECGGSVVFERPMIYTDFGRMHLLALMPTPALRHRSAIAEHVAGVFHRNLQVAAPPMIRDLADRFERRVVFGLPHLREKLVAFEHGIDDRALEALKLWMLRDQGLSWLDPACDVILDAVEGDRLRITLAGAPGPDRTRVVHVRSVPRSNLERAAQVAADMPELQGLVVDWRALFAPDEPLSRPFQEPTQQQLYEHLTPRAES